MTDAATDALVSGPAHWFRDWPNAAMPKAAAGVYTIWQGSTFLYVGMSGRGLTAQHLDQHRADGTVKGLLTRLASHASGRRSGDQFCVYVADRLVLPTLTPDQVREIAEGRRSFDQAIREYIHQQLSYRFAEVGDGPSAARLEGDLRGGVSPVGKPLLNPR